MPDRIVVKRDDGSCATVTLPPYPTVVAGANLTVVPTTNPTTGEVTYTVSGAVATVDTNDDTRLANARIVAGDLVFDIVDVLNGNAVIGTESVTLPPGTTDTFGTVQTATTALTTTNGVAVAIGDEYIVFPDATTWATPSAGSTVTNVDNGDNTSTVTDSSNDTSCFPQCPTAVKARPDCDTFVMEFDNNGLPTGNYIRSDFGISLGQGNGASALSETLTNSNTPQAEDALQQTITTTFDLTTIGFDPTCMNAADVIVRHRGMYHNEGTLPNSAGNKSGFTSAGLNHRLFVSASMGFEDQSQSSGSNYESNNDNATGWVDAPNGILTITYQYMGHPQLDGDDFYRSQHFVTVRGFGYKSEVIT